MVGRKAWIIPGTEDLMPYIPAKVHLRKWIGMLVLYPLVAAILAGIFGYLIIAPCGVHVACLSAVFFYKYMCEANPEQAVKLSMKYGAYFLLPGMLLFFGFFAVLCGVQISAFAKGMTPYPKWCWIFSVPVGMLLTMLVDVFGNVAWANALAAGWISIGNIWMFGGLLLMMKRVKKEIER